jgi:hypothetical protein
MAGFNWEDVWPSKPSKPRKDDGKVDPWAREVTETIRSVINRPKSGLHAEECHKVPNVKGICTPIEVLATGEKFNLFIYWYRTNVSIRVGPSNFEERFNFSVVIFRVKPIKIRKLALVLCKKLVNKAVYDILKS